MAGWELPRAATPLRLSCKAVTIPKVSDTPSHSAGDPTGDPTDTSTDSLDEAQQAINEARERLMGIPAELVVSNHVMGLYELAAIHLGAEPPSLTEAALAIDAVGCLVEGLGARLGPDSDTLVAALSNIRLAFVQIKNAAD
ncbi:hypothetical protein BH10ACT2_BH10ACT2_20780 [soil metagenome]